MRVPVCMSVVLLWEGLACLVVLAEVAWLAEFGWHGGRWFVGLGWLAWRVNVLLTGDAGGRRLGLGQEAAALWTHLPLWCDGPARSSVWKASLLNVAACETWFDVSLWGVAATAQSHGCH